MQFSADVSLVIVQYFFGTGSEWPQPQEPFVWSLYQVVLAHSLPLYVGGQPRHFDPVGLCELEHRPPDVVFIPTESELPSVEFVPAAPTTFTTEAITNVARIMYKKLRQWSARHTMKVDSLGPVLEPRTLR